MLDQISASTGQNKGSLACCLPLRTSPQRNVSIPFVVEYVSLVHRKLFSKNTMLTCILSQGTWWNQMSDSIVHLPFFLCERLSHSTLTAICNPGFLTQLVADSWSVQDKWHVYLNINKTPLSSFSKSREGNRSQEEKRIWRQLKQMGLVEWDRAYKHSESSSPSAVPLHPSTHLAKPCWFSTFAVFFTSIACTLWGPGGERLGWCQVGRWYPALQVSL